MRDPREFPKVLLAVTISELIVFTLAGGVMYSKLGQYTTGNCRTSTIVNEKVLRTVLLNQFTRRLPMDLLYPLSSCSACCMHLSLPAFCTSEFFGGANIDTAILWWDGAYGLLFFSEYGFLLLLLLELFRSSMVSNNPHGTKNKIY